ncbi:MAG: hypothetical protein KY464_13030 [Gemmatimonadetes bacterium]|nr:hypothetical protein [Gemmatimonadota bacterium]
MAAQGQATGRSTTVSFAPTRGRFLRTNQTGTADHASWSMTQLRLYHRAVSQ